MKIFTTLDSINNSEKCAIALGLFDGLHKAHQAVIACAVQSDFVPAVFTFSTNGAFPESKKDFCPLMSESDRVIGIEKLGAKLLLMPDFSEIVNLSAEEFVVDVLFGKMKAEMLCCGYDFRFGKNNAGDVSLLKKLCEEHNKKLVVTDKVVSNQRLVSSSAMRDALKLGDMQSYFDMCSRYFSISSEVVHGNRIGRKINFPTINQPIDTSCLVPKFAVYASITHIDGKAYPSITNIGTKPTVTDDKTVLAETNILDFDGDLYGKTITVELIKFIRDEQKFDSVEALRQAISCDIKAVESLFKS